MSINNSALIETPASSVPPLPYDTDSLLQLEQLQALAGELFSGTPSAGGGRERAELGAAPGAAATLVPASFDLPVEAGLPKADSVAHQYEALLNDLYAASSVDSGVLPVSAALPEASSSFYFVDQLSDPSRALASPALGSAHTPFDVQSVRRDFPILQERVNGKPLVWLDNAATTHKPQAVIDRISYFYQHENSNIHRAAHELAARATDAYEIAREIVRGFINAGSADEIVFVRGTTEAINLVAKSWGKQNIQKDDEIIVSHLEHHANIVPWQQLAAETGARLRVIPVDDSGQILLEEYERLFTPRTKLVSVTQVSNALGTITPAEAVVSIAHRHGARVLIDGAQSVAHIRADVQSLDADWFVFSGHKIFGPTGIGVLYGKKDLLNATQPWQGGGNMIEDVTFERTRYHTAPTRFEAGTGNIADAVGLGAALEYVQKLGLDNINRYEHELLVYATRALQEVPGLRLIGTAQNKASVLSFVLDGYKSEEIGATLNREGIAVRSGHHCAQPILRRFGLETTVRPSLALYNTREEVDLLASTLHGIRGGQFYLPG
ncbi:family 2A encapsulin nanocompartment cargo protein cysteine desulfurase [Candidatus Methylospira mobilis]|uniref:family 2A encapsulin nanocompartment cargo protein cysteine desulfurase n=1 Tax=Candidatus Methylospira mobilis TaxID=1808979 RepID=UPI0028E83828|nr:family 2A encapsulin nanocompartment cargo protein cysteine desulfurase [Candidatus Methylospira mobilis]WNV04764.1 family 2A encapsulin nanocompartment cargo protein cysteine desulfurase [Candidatus Methylospira mobilis]